MYILLLPKTNPLVQSFSLQRRGMVEALKEELQKEALKEELQKQERPLHEGKEREKEQKFPVLQI